MGHPGAAPRAWTSSLIERLPACNPSILPASAGTKGLAGTLLRRYVPSARSKVLLVDFAVFCPPESMLKSYVEQVAIEYRCGHFEPETVDTMVWLHESRHNGVGERTAVAPGSARFQALSTPGVGLSRTPWDLSYTARLEEATVVMFDVAEKAMAAAAVAPKEVDILITVSGFAATPSLASMVACRFGMRGDVMALSLSGHGCAGGLVGIDLAQALLQAGPGRLALVVLAENITNGVYAGQEKPYLTSNILFTVGGAALVMSSRQKDRARAKYELQHIARTLTTDQKVNACVGFRDDAAGVKGMFVDPDVLKTAVVAAISATLARLAPSVLPLRELARAARSRRHRPDFSATFQHLALHPGALPVMRKVAQALRFSAAACQPSVATLERYGNTSCSSTLYVLAHIEHHQGVRRGEKVLQLAMGTGLRCLACTWRARRGQRTQHAAWAPAAGFAKHPPGWTRPRALALAAAQARFPQLKLPRSAL